jgi:hypothetical protein
MRYQASRFVQVLRDHRSLIVTRMVCPSPGTKSCRSYLALAALSMWALYLLNVVKGSSVLLLKSDLKTSSIVSNTTADALLCFVLHEEAHNISILVVMAKISHRCKRHRLASYLLHCALPHIDACQVVIAPNPLLPPALRPRRPGSSSSAKFWNARIGTANPSASTRCLRAPFDMLARGRAAAAGGGGNGFEPPSRAVHARALPIELPCRAVGSYKKAPPKRAGHISPYNQRKLALVDIGGAFL